MELTGKMLHKDICKPFKEKVDPVRDGALNYNEIVRRPMDLTTIRKNLTTNEYKTIDDWIAAVELVWANAMLFNGEGTLIHLMAKEMELWFRKKCETMPRSKDEEWMAMLGKATRKMQYLSQHPPTTIIPKVQIVSEEKTAKAEHGRTAKKAETRAEMFGDEE